MTRFKELVMFNIGKASMAWSEIPMGVFDLGKYSELGNEIVEAHEVEIAAIKAERALFAKAVMEAEWAVRNEDGFSKCPWCSQYHLDKNHKPDCVVVKAIDNMRDAAKESNER